MRDAFRDVKASAWQLLDCNADAVARLSDAIFYFGELGMQDHRSASLMIDLMERHGFKVDCTPSGFEAGFVARYRSGAPILAVHTEYDVNPDNPTNVPVFT